MTMTALAALVVPILAAYGALRWSWRTGPPTLTRALAASLAPALGLGFSSCLSFALLLTGLSRSAVLRLDAAVWSVVLLAVAAHAWQRRATSPSTDGAHAGSMRADRLAAVVVAVGTLALFVLAARVFWVHATLRPHGEWDAWAIWNLRARALLRGMPDWASVLSDRLAWSNVDYPLLLPVTVARLWAFAGAEAGLVPAVVAFLFFTSTVATVGVLVGQARGWIAGLLSAAVLIAPHTYVFQASCQCADVPLAGLMLAAVACSAMAWQGTEARSLSAVAGAAAGLAAWTKNEGQMFLLLLLVVLAVFPTRDRVRKGAWFAVGAAVPLLALVWFKLRMAPPNYLFTPTALAGLLERLRDADRWSLIRSQLTALVPAWGEIGGGGLLILAAVVTMTARVSRPGVQACGFGLAVLVLMAIGYILVYAVTPLPLLWQITTSFPRLMTHLWPALVWALFQLSDAGHEATSR